MDKKIIIAVVAVVAVIAIAISVFLLTKNTDTIYTISFNTDGGGKIVSQKVEEGNTATKPNDPVKDGYEFLGWYLNDKEFDFKTPIEEDLTLKAKWKEIVVEDDKNDDKVEEDKEDETDKEEEEDKDNKVTKYTVKFDSDGGSKVASKTVEKNKTVKQPANPTKDGYKFLGWYLGNTKYNFSKKVTKNITLTAKWEKVQEEKPVEPETPVAPEVTKYTVTFDANGGTAVAKQTIEEGKTATTPKAPTKTGYTFLGWYLGNTKFDFSTKITSNITLKAEWKKDDVVKVDIVKDEGSSTGQYIIYVTLNGNKVAGTVDITNSKGVTKTVSIPVTGLSRPEGSFTTVTNPKVK